MLIFLVFHREPPNRLAGVFLSAGRVFPQSAAALRENRKGAIRRAGARSDCHEGLRVARVREVVACTVGRNRPLNASAERFANVASRESAGSSKSGGSSLVMYERATSYDSVLTSTRRTLTRPVAGSTSAAKSTGVT